LSLVSNNSGNVLYGYSISSNIVFTIDIQSLPNLYNTYLTPNSFNVSTNIIKLNNKGGQVSLSNFMQNNFTSKNLNCYFTTDETDFVKQYN
jgi:hypothetical protein